MSASRNLGVAVARGSVRRFPRLRRRLAAISPRASDPRGRRIPCGRPRGRGHVALAQLDRRRRRPGCGSPHDDARRAALHGAAAAAAVLRDLRDAGGAMCRPCAACWCDVTRCSRSVVSTGSSAVCTKIRSVRQGGPAADRRHRPSTTSAVPPASRGRHARSRSPNGAWSREGPSPAATRFFTWMQSYVDRETGARIRGVDDRRAQPRRTTARLRTARSGAYAVRSAARRRSRSRRGPPVSPPVEPAHPAR